MQILLRYLAHLMLLLKDLQILLEYQNQQLLQQVLLVQYFHLGLLVLSVRLGQLAQYFRLVLSDHLGQLGQLDRCFLVVL